MVNDYGVDNDYNISFGWPMIFEKYSTKGRCISGVIYRLHMSRLDKEPILPFYIKEMMIYFVGGLEQDLMFKEASHGNIPFAKYCKAVEAIGLSDISGGEKGLRL